MNTSKLYKGQTFKNYKEMCTELGMEIKTSTNSKNSQYKELERYCKYNKIGHKISIEEVYETPEDKIDNRGAVSIYRDIVQLLITDLLAQCDGQISISRNRLMSTIGMINVNYTECREQVPKLSKFIDVDEKFIYDFYNTSTSSFRSIIETALNSLMDKRVIMYGKIIKVSDKGIFNSRNATGEEIREIMEIEKEILEEMGYKQISHVRVSKDWKKFRLKVKSLLNKQTDIDFYFTAYDITINEKYIVNERNELADLLLEKLTRQESKSELNNLIYINVLQKAQHRHEKGFTAGRMAKTRLDSNYVENIKELADVLIDRNCPNISIKLKEVDTVPMEAIDSELERLFG
jgi:uncharacterized protein YdeI (BOF family)